MRVRCVMYGSPHRASDALRHGKTLRVVLSLARALHARRLAQIVHVCEIAAQSQRAERITGLRPCNRYSIPSVTAYFPYAGAL